MPATARRLGLAAAVVIALAVLGGRPAAAEWFADVFTGVGLTQSHDFKLNDPGIGPGTYDDVSFDKALAFGGRFGRYFDSLPFLGFGVDYLHFTPLRRPAVGQSPRVLLSRRLWRREGRDRHVRGDGELGLFGPDAPSAAAQVDGGPAGAGPALSGGWGAALHHHHHPAQHQELPEPRRRHRRLDRRQGAAGVALQIYQNLMLFAEYRFTHVSPDVELHDGSTNRVKLSTDLNTHSALIGLSARW